MSTKQEDLRKRVVQMYEKWKLHPKSMTVAHFIGEGYKANTIYGIIRRYEKTGTWVRQSGQGRKALIMNKNKKKALKQMFNNRDGVSTRDAGKKFGCCHTHIRKTLLQMGIKKRKKQRAPQYDEDQIQEVKRCCRWMVRKYVGKSFVLDDEKYFTLSATQMPGNDVYYTNDPSTTPPKVKLKFKMKFEPKVMLYIVISEKGISKPYIHKTRLAIDQNLYKDQCINKVLLPFLSKYHSDGKFVFWPDKASAHYAASVREFLSSRNIEYVPKQNNPTNLPQCRPIEDFFGQLSAKVYAKGWRATTLDQLERKVRKCVKEVDLERVQRSCGHIKAKLRVCGINGPYELVH